MYIGIIYIPTSILIFQKKNRTPSFILTRRTSNGSRQGFHFEPLREGKEKKYPESKDAITSQPKQVCSHLNNIVPYYNKEIESTIACTYFKGTYSKSCWDLAKSTAVSKKCV